MPTYRLHFILFINLVERRGVLRVPPPVADRALRVAWTITDADTDPDCMIARGTRGPRIIQIYGQPFGNRAIYIAPFGDAYEKIGTIQRRLAWPLHKDDTLFQSGRPTGLNIYFSHLFFIFSLFWQGIQTMTRLDRFSVGSETTFE